eukprot:5034106-Pyramimonas_sp.AAC.1
MISLASTRLVCSSRSRGSTAPSTRAVHLSARRAVSHVSRAQRRKVTTLHRCTVSCSAEDSTNPGDSQLLRTIATNGEAVVTLARTTSVANDAIRRHQTSPTVSGALGRGLTAVMLMASFRGEGEQ